MKKLLAVACLLLAGNVSAGVIDPAATNQYVKHGRFVTTTMTRGTMYVITDTKSGCQYLVDEFNKTTQPLGCFNEYKK